MNRPRRILVLVYLMSVCVVSFGGEDCPNIKTDFKSVRKRRYLAFPDGSDAVMTMECAKSFLTHVPSGWMMTMGVDVIFPLPEKEFIVSQLRRKLHHRQKKELWDRVKNALYLHNLNGHACVLRSICEAKLYLAPPGKSLVHDLLRAIFTAPLLEEEFINEIGEDMYQQLSDPNVCDRIGECPFSLIQFFLNFNKKKNL